MAQDSLPGLAWPCCRARGSRMRSPAGALRLSVMFPHHGDLQNCRVSPAIGSQTKALCTSADLAAVPCLQPGALSVARSALGTRSPVGRVWPPEAKGAPTPVMASAWGRIRVAIISPLFWLACLLPQQLVPRVRLLPCGALVSSHSRQCVLCSCADSWLGSAGTWDGRSPAGPPTLERVEWKSPRTR